MLPPRIESTRVRRRRSRKIWLLLPLMAVLGFLIYRYGEPLYLAVQQRFMPENLQLLESRISHIQTQFVTHSSRSEKGVVPGYSAFSDEEREAIITYLKDSRRILSFYEGSSETGAALQANAALFQFYELLLYLQLDEAGVLTLAGRGFLPSTTGIKTEAFREKAREALILSRKSLAMDPTQGRVADLRLIEVVSDLLYNERTDSFLFDELSGIDQAKVSDGLQPTYAFIALALLARSGNKQALNDSLTAQQTKLDPSDETVRLLRVYTLFHARDYIQALQMSQALAFDAQADVAARSEALRMIAEIYAVQTGPAAGLPYLIQARDLRPDPFLDERIQQWQSGQR